MSKTVISVRNLGKKYRLGATLAPNTLRDHIMQGVRRLTGRGDGKGSTEDFWALKDVSFDVEEGEVLGVIGANGAGKSTLLKILTGITEPTEGEIRMKGRVASLLEVGTGFHPELSGRENIYMNGAILGMTRAEITAKFDEIVEFAGVGKFLDTPVKRYSSGMRVRLGFAVAAHLEPEILLVDEVLAVGDVSFQNRCLGKMDEVAHSGRTVLFVSHNMGAIGKLCSRTIVLDHGAKIFDGDTPDGVRTYLKGSLVGSEGNGLIEVHERNFDTDSPQRLTGIEVLDRDRQPLDSIATGDFVCFRIHFDFSKALTQPSFGFRFFSGDHDELARIISYACGYNINELQAGKGCIDCVVEKFPFTKGDIVIDLDLVRDGRERLHVVENAVEINVQGGDYYGSGIHFDQAKHHGFVVLPHKWSLIKAEAPAGI